MEEGPRGFLHSAQGVGFPIQPNLGLPAVEAQHSHSQPAHRHNPQRASITERSQKTQSQECSLKTVTVPQETTEEHHPSVETAGPEGSRLNPSHTRAGVRGACGTTAHGQRHRTTEDTGTVKEVLAAAQQPWGRSCELCLAVRSAQRPATCSGVRRRSQHSAASRKGGPRARRVSTRDTGNSGTRLDTECGRDHSRLQTEL